MLLAILLALAKVLGLAIIFVLTCALCAVACLGGWVLHTFFTNWE